MKRSEQAARPPIPEGLPPGEEFRLRPVSGFSYLLAGLVLLSSVFACTGLSFFPDTPFTRTTGGYVLAYWFIAFGIVPAVAALAVVIQLLVAAVWLTDGRLTVRSWPRWRQRRVELTLLRSVDVKPHVTLGFSNEIEDHSPPIDNEFFRERKTTLLILTDGLGAEVRVNPFFWQDTPSLVGAIRSAALRTRADLTPAAREYLGLETDQAPA